MCFVVVVVVVVVCCLFFCWFPVGLLLVCCCCFLWVFFFFRFFFFVCLFVCFCLFFVCLMTPLEHFALLFIGGCQTFDNISPRKTRYKFPISNKEPLTYNRLIQVYNTGFPCLDDT